MSLVCERVLPVPEEDEATVFLPSAIPQGGAGPGDGDSVGRSKMGLEFGKWVLITDFPNLLCEHSQVA